MEAQVKLPSSWRWFVTRSTVRCSIGTMPKLQVLLKDHVLSDVGRKMSVVTAFKFVNFLGWAT
jgi:hypothetical protein